MIEPSVAMASDDRLSVPCRIRKSETVSDPHFDDYVEMTCTMRDWVESPRRSSLTGTSKASSVVVVDGEDKIGTVEQQPKRRDCPELVLSPTSFLLDRNKPIVVSEVTTRQQNRSGSGSRQRSTSGAKSRPNSIDRRRIWNEFYAEDHDSKPPRPPPPPKSYTIPISEIVVVDSVGTQSNNYPVMVTTQSMGYYWEFTFSTSNAHDVFLAFLTNALSSERVLRTCSTPIDQGSKSFDVETLTAHRMQQRVQGESLAERVRRKVNFIANRLDEWSKSFAENGCLCDIGGSTKGNDTSKTSKPSTRRFDFPTELEVEVPSPRSKFHAQ